MAFGTQQNNDRDNGINVNTRSCQLLNKEGFDPSALSIGAWNEMMSLRINPALEPSKQTESRIFDYDRSVSTSLTMEKVMLLLYKINKEIVPAINDNIDKSIGIPLNNGESLIVIGTGKKYTNEIRPFLAIHKSLNANTRKPEMSMFYEFKRAYTIDDYDEKTGEYSMVTDIHSEFKLFIELLKAFIIGSSNFTPHADRVSNYFRNEKLNKNINAIAQKVGVPVESYGNKSYNNKPNVFANNSKSNNDDTDVASIDELGNIDDLNALMNA